MADLSLEAKHLLKMMQTDTRSFYEPLRGEKEQKAMEELRFAGLARSRTTVLWTLTHEGYDRSLTRD